MVKKAKQSKKLKKPAKRSQRPTGGVSKKYLPKRSHEIYIIQGQFEEFRGEMLAKHTSHEMNFKAIRLEIRNLSNKMDERFAAIEARFGAIDERFSGIDQRFISIDERFNQIDERFKQIDARFNQIDERFKQIDARFDQIDERFKQIDARFDQIDERFIALEARIDKKFEEFEAKIDAKFNNVIAAIHQLGILINEQNARNKFVLDGYANLYEKFEQHKIDQQKQIDDMMVLIKNIEPKV